jgi:hypothetical protein
LRRRTLDAFCPRARVQNGWRGHLARDDRKGKELDSSGGYRVVKGDDLSAFPSSEFDPVLAAFPFDNIPGFDTKERLFRDLARLLNATGKIINIVSSPEIYTHEWASFSTKDYPGNKFARPGDVVRIVTTDFGDGRPMEDIFWPDESYRQVYARAGLDVVATYRPLTTGNEHYKWVNETKIAPWVVYVLSPKHATPD